MDIHWKMIARIIKMMQREWFLLERANVAKSCFSLRLWLFFFFSSPVIFKLFLSCLEIIKLWRLEQRCLMLCVVLSGQVFRPVEGDTDSVVKGEVTLCCRQVAGLTKAADRSAFFFCPFNHEGEQVFWGNTEEQVSRKGKFLGLPSVAVCLVCLK